MRSLRYLLVLAVVLAALGAVVAFAATPPQHLPALAGWRKSAATVANHAGWQLPAPEAAAMAEYGLHALERDSYQRGSRQVSVEGLHFHDASGAYGAFTYYRQPGAQALSLGKQHRLAAASAGTVLFLHGDWLLRVSASGDDALAHQVARKLAAALPGNADAALSLPDLPQFLPRDHQVAGTLHYSEGPAAFAAFCHWLPANAVGFDKSAETALAGYNVPGQPPGAQMLVISYPTPQMARTHLDQFRQGGYLVRRSGPLLILVHGLSETAAAPLLHSVNFDADFAFVPPKYVGLEGLPGLILGSFVLVALVFGVSLVLGVITGGLHALLDQMLPERFRRRRPEALVRLHLGQPPARMFRSGRPLP